MWACSPSRVATCLGTFRRRVRMRVFGWSLFRRDTYMQDMRMGRSSCGTSTPSNKYTPSISTKPPSQPFAYRRSSKKWCPAAWTGRSSFGTCSQRSVCKCTYFSICSKSAHHNAITAISLTTIVYCGQPTPAIASIGKDGYFRLWTHQALCLGVTSCHATEALGMHMDKYTGIFYVCTNKEEMV